MSKTVRTRFAPSPTGYMHIGNLRTALYEYLIAKSNGGKFILRIEDTDQERLVEGATDVIFDTLRITGLKHDEGPDIGGDYGPYVQSLRKDIYIEYAKRLIEKNKAYYCFCTRERLAKLKEENEGKTDFNKYDGFCRNLSNVEIETNLSNNVPYIIRQKMPNEGKTEFEDAVFGKIAVDNDQIDDQILIKSDGLPTYNFANVVDDHLMEITHVVRGSEYLSSMPKYNLLYDAFGWEIPTYVHLPPVMKNATEKLSKRSGDASFQDLIEQGYLVEAVLNYIALLGWSPGGTQEMYSLKQLEEIFSIEGISKSPAIFDIEKLTWLNGEYIRNMSEDEFYKLAKPYLENSIKNKNIDLKKVSKILKARTEVLTVIPSKVDFFDELPEYSTDIYVHQKMKTSLENSLENLKKVLPILENIKNWSEETIHDEVVKLVAELEIKNGQMFWPIRTAITGKEVSPGGAIEIADILGKEEIIRRIKIGIDKLS